MKHLYDVLINLMYSGLYQSEKIDEEEKMYILFLNASIFIAAFTLTFMGIQSFYFWEVDQKLADLFMTIADCMAFATMIFLFWYFRQNKNRILISYFMSIALFLFCLVMIYLGSYKDTGYLWIAAFQIMATMLLGYRGVIISVALILSSMILAFFNIKVDSANYSSMQVGTIFGVSAVVLAFSVAFYSTAVSYVKRVGLANKNLQEQNDFVRLIKENGSTICLVDEGMFIQPEYSKKLEVLFGQSNLIGKDFISLVIEHSLGVFDSTDLRATLELFFDPNIRDMEMLQEVSQNHELKIFQDVKDVESFRIIDLGFKKIDFGEKSFLVCFIEDITEVRRLQQEKEEYEGKEFEGRQRMQDISILFQSHKGEVEWLLPSIKGDLDEVNSLFEVHKSSPREDLLNKSFQIVHTIKAMVANVLKIDSITNAFHELEERIGYASGDVRDVDRFVGIMIALKICNNEIDALRDMYDDMFNSEKSIKDKNIVVMVLESTISNVGHSSGKSANLDLSKFNSEAIPGRYNKVVIDFLNHLIRNSFAHGIEDVTQRIASKKPEKALIVVSCGVKDGRFILNYSDDGMGLDFDAIRSKALSIPKFVSEGVATWDEKKLKGLIFRDGFSTSSKVDLKSGRGFGMSFIYSKIKELGGSIAVDSKKGESFRFAMSLPI